jgi:hypothetical protein
MPLKRPRKIVSHDDPISRELHSAIVDHVACEGRTLYSLAKLAGLDEATLRKFQSRERSIKLESVDRLAAFLGLKLVRSARAKPKLSVLQELVTECLTEDSAACVARSLERNCLEGTGVNLTDRPALALDDVSSD